ncbi:MAG: hypothetical protein EBS31_02840, partial [Burkholderiaceae bacterium]|nr:hypothetical protein [Burkholderiaceae bacterium]
MTINQRPVTVTVTSGQTKVYGNQDPSSFTFTAQAEGTNVGLLTGTSLAGALARASGENVGTYAINSGTLSTANPNYTITLVPGDFTITARPITVVIADQTKQYDSTNAASLIAGTNANSGSYTLSGFVAGEGAYITQTVGSYNSPNVADATSVSASVASSYVAKSGTLLSNYILPATVSTAANGASITPAPLTMIADNVSTFVGMAPTLTYQLVGLLGSDTASTAILNPQVTYEASLLNASMVAPQPNALTPSANSSNYSLTFVKGSLLVAGNYQIIVSAGSNTASYGLINRTNVNYLGNALNASHNVTAAYCTNCEEGASTPNIISLAITAPSTGSNLWLAADSGVGAAQGRYNFEISPTISNTNYGQG